MLAQGVRGIRRAGSSPHFAGHCEPRFPVFS